MAHGIRAVNSSASTEIIDILVQLMQRQQLETYNLKPDDLLYRYGFDEKSANFQNNNFGRGGVGNDGVLAVVQSPTGFNNANFGTPPDGRPGRMNMYVWTRTVPRRDGDVDNGIIVHELTHGLSNRLTGGLGNGACLGILESGGMGEGWSDTLAWSLTMKANMTRATTRTMGSYAINEYVKGIRRFPYSTDMTVNPNTYNQLATLTRVHDIGDVWSSILYEVYWNMVDQAGFDPEIYNSASQAGNVRFIQNVVSGMKIQPCNPTLLNARDAIITADSRINDGRFFCAIWRGFAKRGMGFGAKQDATYTNSFTLPPGC
ncbi:Fungalysin/Thermolysin Extracellular metalloproteinase 5 [Phlyctochytrium bullatum]|nr:Fungalysin/Thermolysin Extracellular metalloproteinase 5 [Phlyctochytrium bullatum]